MSSGASLAGPSLAVPTLAGTAFAAGPRYLNTAAIGLPPRVVVDAVGDRLAEWEAGGSLAPSFDPDVDRARRAYARIAGTTPDAVALVNQVSLASGLVAGSLPGGARVLCAEEDFASVLAPFLADDRLRVTTVPLAGLLDAVTPAVDLVAVSAVQSADGRVLDLDALADAATAAGARTYVDVTQAAGWLPLGADRFDVTSVGAYKWLCSPRGSGFLTVGPHNDWLRPSWAGWYSAPDPWGDLYGPPLRLATDARRFDVSPPWFAIVGAARALELIDHLGVEAIGAHSVALANRFRAGLDLAPSDSAIVSVASGRGTDLAEAGYVASERAGKVRVSFYLYNAEADADGAAAVLAGRPVPATPS